MKRINKILSLILLGALLTAAPSCTNLDETIYSQISTEDTPFSDQEVKAMLAPVYSNLRGVYWGWNGLFDAYEESSDLIMTPLRIGIGWGDLYVTMHKHTYHPYVDHFWTIWNFSYGGIGSVNVLLDMKANPVVAPYENELRAMRALYYYILLDNFRNIPLLTTMNLEPGYLPEQADPKAVFDFIVTELNDIKGKITDDTSVKNYGKFNKYAVCMLLAKMYLNYNTWFGQNDNTYYQKAITEVNDILKGNKYSLAGNYTDPFVDDASSCPEVIYAIPYDLTYAAGNYLSNKTLYGASTATFGLASTPWGGSCAIPQFINSYDPDDARLKLSWISGLQYAQDGTTPIIIKSDDNKQLNYTVDVHSIDDPGAYYNEGARFVKYKIYPGIYGTYADDVPFFRLTDALMIKAECLLRLGGYNGETEQDAATIVTNIRMRAFKNTKPEKATRTVAQLKGGSVYKYGHYENEQWKTIEGGADIELGGFLDELAWEFVGEHHRRQDLIRFKIKGKDVNVYNGKSWFCKDAEKDLTDKHKNIFPIYQDFLDGNMKLKQNPGYTK